MAAARVLPPANPRLGATANVCVAAAGSAEWQSQLITTGPSTDEEGRDKTRINYHHQQFHFLVKTTYYHQAKYHHRQLHEVVEAGYYHQLYVWVANSKYYHHLTPAGLFFATYYSAPSRSSGHITVSF